MVSDFRTHEQDHIKSQNMNIFRREYKIKYKKKLSGKTRLYISEKNAIKGLTGILSLYRRELQ